MRNISPADLDKTVWRYLTFKKYKSLIDFRAIWFSKLNILIDEFEGAMPSKIDAKMRKDHQAYKKFFPENMHGQIDEMNQRNVSDGRELTLVSCWFCSETESERMWNEYAGITEGVAIKSTIRMLLNNLMVPRDLSLAGKVRYVNLEIHEMTAHEASQAQERAFLKSNKFAHEEEFRITTFNVKGPHCVNFDGTPMHPADYAGAKMNNFDKPGLNVRADLEKLISTTVLAPRASREFAEKIRKIAATSGIGNPVVSSSLE